MKAELILFVQETVCLLTAEKRYAHSSSEKLWSLSWIHFYGLNMTAIYDKYLERGGRAVFTPFLFLDSWKSVTGFMSWQIPMITFGI